MTGEARPAWQRWFSVGRLTVLAIGLLSVAVLYAMLLPVYQEHLAIQEAGRRGSSAYEIVPRTPVWVWKHAPDDWQSLKMLNLDGVPIDDGQLRVICKFQQLEYLDISGSQVTDDGLASLHALPRLNELYLAGTGITDVGLRHLGRMERLEGLNLTGTRVTLAGVAELRRKFPHCKVFW